MDAKTARTENIRRLVREAGGPAEFARTYGGSGDKVWTQSQVSQWISESNPKGIGHALAREIELRVGLAAGAMDKAAEAASQSVSMDAERMRMAARYLEELFRQYGKEFKASEHTDLLVSVYQDFSSNSVSRVVAMTVKYGPMVERAGKDDGQEQARGTGTDGRSGNRRGTR